jgi:ComF family protein
MVYKWLESALSAAYPAVCVLCGAPGQPDRDICPGCAAELPLNSNPCPRCAEPLPPEAPGGTLCSGCLRSAPAFDACLAPWLYAPPLDWLLSRLKFHGQLAAGRVLAELLADRLTAHGADRPELMVPMPLHPARLRERGFNQALELARPLGRRLGIPVAPDLVRRVRASQPQSSLAKARRRANVRGAFSLRGPVNGLHLVVLDDVLTTGASSDELARTLKRAGATRVDVWVVARTPP